ncbi:CRTAC1 family protein [Haloglomus litoreum]|uniref:CRTAC1 family protein n=1 Tax=Haloglomus litoreum TaxID=3034026 RepID=UPI0023E7D162|nr:CRTAC1 family protein [Haloglomus sp. DT116]
MLADRSDLLPDREPMRATGVAVSEFDGAPLVLVAGYGEANRLFRGATGDAAGDGTAGLADVAAELRDATATGGDPYGEAEPVADPAGHAVGVAAADADADGEEEWYVHNAGPFAREVLEPGADGGLGSPEPDQLLDPHGDDGLAGWLDLLADGRNRRGRNLRVGRSVAALDRTGDGTYAFLVTGDASPARLQTVAAGSVTDRAPEVGIDFLGGGRSVVAGPARAVDTAGSAGCRMDLVLGMERGPNLLLRNDGGGFTDFAPELGVSDTHGDARGAALVDLGNALGLALGNDRGRNRLWDLRRGSPAGDVTPEPFAEPGPVRTVLAADLDNDGAQELFVTCHGAPNRLFRRVGPDHRDAAEWERVDPGAAAEPDIPTTGAVAADLDGDGALELFVAHGGPEGEPLSVYGHPDAADGWLRVRPLTRHGAPARGALVTLDLDGGPHREQRRVVDAGSGYLCQGEPVAHFGLGDATPRRVRVHWPDGETATAVESPESDRVLDVPFPG